MRNLLASAFWPKGTVEVGLGERSKRFAYPETLIRKRWSG